jgi:hypothetical protein
VQFVTVLDAVPPEAGEQCVYGPVDQPAPQTRRSWTAVSRSLSGEGFATGSTARASPPRTSLGAVLHRAGVWTRPSRSIARGWRSVSGAPAPSTLSWRRAWRTSPASCGSAARSSRRARCMSARWLSWTAWSRVTTRRAGRACGCWPSLMRIAKRKRGDGSGPIFLNADGTDRLDEPRADPPARQARRDRRRRADQPPPRSTSMQEALQISTMIECSVDARRRILLVLLRWLMDPISSPGGPSPETAATRLSPRMA